MSRHVASCIALAREDLAVARKLISDHPRHAAFNIEQAADFSLPEQSSKTPRAPHPAILNVVALSLHAEARKCNSCTMMSTAEQAELPYADA